MSFTVVEAPQRSAEWFAARVGRLTASRANDMLAINAKREPLAGRKNLKAQLVLERLTGKPQESGFVSNAMLQGIEREADALALYEGLTGRLLTATGFLRHDTLMVGCSLDGHVGNFEGLVEAKCPQPATHLEYLQSGVVPMAYRRQIVHCLWMTGAQWCDWLSFNPDFPDALQVKLVRVERNDAEIKDYAAKVDAFLAEVETEVAALRTQFNLSEVLSEAVA